MLYSSLSYDDVIKWKHFPRYWPFVRGMHRSPVHSPHKGQWRGALMFSLNCARINGWANNREAGDLRHHRAHYDVIVMHFCRWMYFRHTVFVTPLITWPPFFLTTFFNYIFRKFVNCGPHGQNSSNQALVQIMLWRRIGDKPLSEPMIDEYVRHQWVNANEM